MRQTNVGVVTGEAKSSKNDETRYLKYFRNYRTNQRKI